MKILFVTANPPDQIRTRPLHLIRGLVRSGHQVTAATLWDNEAEHESVERLRAEVDEVICVRSQRIRSLFNCAGAAATAQPMQYLYSWNPKLAQRVGRAVVEDGFDVVHVEHLRAVRYASHAQAIARKAGVRIPVIWDSVDCISRLFEQARSLAVGQAARLIAAAELAPTQRYESRLAASFPRVLVTSSADRLALLELIEKRRPELAAGCSERIQVVPNGVDSEYFTPRQDDEEADPDAIVITGKMSYHANVSAVVRFVERVMPRVWEQRPTTKLWIVGKDPTPAIRRLGGTPQVQVTGYVADLRPHLQRAAVASAPLVYGVGIQNKVLEAMACGAAVTASPGAASAISAIAGKELLVADGEAELATQTLLLLDDKRRRAELGANARRFVVENHDWSRTSAKVLEIYNEAIETHAARN